MMNSIRKPYHLCSNWQNVLNWMLKWFQFMRLKCIWENFEVNSVNSLGKCFETDFNCQKHSESWGLNSKFIVRQFIEYFVSQRIIRFNRPNISLLWMRWKSKMHFLDYCQSGYRHTNTNKERDRHRDRHKDREKSIWNSNADTESEWNQCDGNKNSFQSKTKMKV